MIRFFVAISALLLVAGPARSSNVSLSRGVRPVRMSAAPEYVGRACERSRLLQPACPRRLPYVGREPAWSVQVCLRGRRGCLGLTWDDLELSHVDYGPIRPPTWAHVSLFAGELTAAFPFTYPSSGKPLRLRDGLFARTRTRPLFFGLRRWGAKVGTLVLAPGYPGGGEQGDHLIFRWRSHGIEYAIGLHGWEPLTQVEVTLHAIVSSTGASIPPKPPTRR